MVTLQNYMVRVIAKHVSAWGVDVEQLNKTNMDALMEELMEPVVFVRWRGVYEIQDTYTAKRHPAALDENDIEVPVVEIYKDVEDGGTGEVF